MQYFYCLKKKKRKKSSIRILQCFFVSGSLQGRLDKLRASCKTKQNPFLKPHFPPSLLKAARVPSGKTTHNVLWRQRRGIGHCVHWLCQESSPVSVTFCCSPSFTSVPCLASLQSFPLSPSLSHDPGLCFVQGLNGITPYGSPRGKGQQALVENPKKLVWFSSWRKPIKVASMWTDANSLDLLAWAQVSAERLPLLLNWE